MHHLIERVVDIKIIARFIGESGSFTQVRPEFEEI